MVVQSKTTMKKYKFKATIQPGDGGGAFVVFPFDVEKEFGTKGKVPVSATYEGVAESTSLFRYGYPQHLLSVSKAIHQKIGKSPGETIQIELWKADENRTIEVPPDFQKLLKQEGLLPFFEKLSYTHRKEYCRWITEAKKEETRAKRLDKAIEMLKKKVKTPG